MNAVVPSSSEVSLQRLAVDDEVAEPSGSTSCSPPTAGVPLVATGPLGEEHGVQREPDQVGVVPTSLDRA